MFFKNPESTKFFHEILCFIYLEGCKVSFYVTVTSALLISIENFYFVEKRNKEDFVKKIRWIRGQENM